MVNAGEEEPGAFPPNGPTALTVNVWLNVPSVMKLVPLTECDAVHVLPERPTRSHIVLPGVTGALILTVGLFPTNDAEKSLRTLPS